MQRTTQCKGNRNKAGEQQRNLPPTRIMQMVAQYTNLAPPAERCYRINRGQRYKPRVRELLVVDVWCVRCFWTSHITPPLLSVSFVVCCDVIWTRTKCPLRCSVSFVWRSGLIWGAGTKKRQLHVAAARWGGWNEPRHRRQYCSQIGTPRSCEKMSPKNVNGMELYFRNTECSRAGANRKYIYCCCITETCTGMYNTQSYTARKWHGFSVGIELDLVVVWVVEIDLISEWGIGGDLILCGGRKWLGLESESKLTWSTWRRACKIDPFFFSGDRNWLSSVSGSKFTWFCVGARN